jgi:hypothetical protein
LRDLPLPAAADVRRFFNARKRTDDDAAEAVYAASTARSSPKAENAQHRISDLERSEPILQWTWRLNAASGTTSSANSNPNPHGGRTLKRGWLALIAGANNFVAPKATLEAATPAFLFLAGCAFVSALACILISVPTVVPSGEQEISPALKLEAAS